MNTTPSDPSSPDPDGTPSWGSPNPSEPTASFGAEPPQYQQGSQYQEQSRHQQYPQGPGAPGAPGAPSGGRFFDSVRRWGVVRPDPGHGRWVAGVCAGLAHRWGMSPLLVRGLFVLFGALTGVGLLAYGVLWLLLPHPDGRIHAQQVTRGVVTGGFVGSVLAIVAGLPSGSTWVDGQGHWHHAGPGWFPLALVALVVWWLVRRRRSDHVHHG